MNLLGLDTSTAATAVCVARADGEIFERVPSLDALLGPPGHARELMPTIVGTMGDAGLAWTELDAVAVGIGPGTYTGLRIGIATARSLAQARGIAVHPVSSLRALAAGIGAPLALPLIDARRGELFAALHADGEERWRPFVARPEVLVEWLRSARFEAGGPPLAAGDGSLRFRDVLEAAGVEVAPDGSPAHVVRALHVCRLAAGVPATLPAVLVPRYLRAPDAKPSR